MTEQNRAIRPFDQVLRDMSGGRLVADLTDELTEVIAAIRRSGKPGELRLTLTLKPRGETNEQLEVIPTIKASKPEAAKPISIFFVNADNGMQRDDPTQHHLPGLTPVRDFDPKTGEVLNG